MYKNPFSLLSYNDQILTYNYNSPNSEFCVERNENELKLILNIFDGEDKSIIFDIKNEYKILKTGSAKDSNIIIKYFLKQFKLNKSKVNENRLSLSKAINFFDSMVSSKESINFILEYIDIKSKNNIELDNVKEELKKHELHYQEYMESLSKMKDHLSNIDSNYCEDKNKLIFNNFEKNQNKHFDKMKKYKALKTKEFSLEEVNSKNETSCLTAYYDIYYFRSLRNL
jgi:hypothetical protein